MTAITPVRAYQLLRAAGFSSAQAVTLTAVGQGESGLNPDAVGDVNLQTSTWGPSVGIWQIRTLKAETGKGTPRDINKLRGDPAAQARAARAVFLSQGFKAWSVYTSGAYKSHLTAAKRAASSSPGGGVAIDPGPTASQAGLPLPGPGLLPHLKDPLNWAGALANGFGDAAGDVVTAPARLLWSVIQPFALTTMFAAAGIGIVLIGAATLTKPVRDAVSETTEQVAAPLAMAV